MSENEKKVTEKLSEREKKTPATAHRPLVKKRRVTTTMMPEARYDDAYGKENPYYIRIANHYRIAKYVTILLTLVFAFTMLTVYSQDITVENFQYLMKDLDLSGIASEGNFDSLVYNGGTDSSFGIYRSELVVVNAGSTSLYRSSGALSFHQSNVYYAPKLLVSDKYFLVYDFGETSNSYAVYNSFAELKSEQLSFPITGADLSEDGAYAIVTRDEHFRGIVRVYDRDFRLKNEIKKDKYILSVAMTSDGKRLAIASVYDKDGDFVTELMTLQVGSSEADTTVTVEGAMPLKTEWMQDGSLAVLYTDFTAIYDNDGEEIARIEHASLPSLSVSLGKSMICVAYNNTVLGYDKTVKLYDSSGALLYTMALEGELLQIVLREGEACLLFEDRIVSIDPYNDRVLTAAIDPNPIAVVFAEDIPIVCYSGSAVTPDFSS